MANSTGGGERVKSSMGTKNFNLGRSQVKKQGNIDLFLFFLPVHHLNSRFDNVSIFYLALLNSVVKISILR
jgi:hypothetical protein